MGRETEIERERGERWIQKEDEGKRQTDRQTESGWETHRDEREGPSFIIQCCIFTCVLRQS